MGKTGIGTSDFVAGSHQGEASLEILGNVAERCVFVRRVEKEQVTELRVNNNRSKLSPVAHFHCDDRVIELLR